MRMYALNVKIGQHSNHVCVLRIGFSIHSSRVCVRKFRSFLCVFCSIFGNAAMPFGQMPILEVDGQRVHQSLAIVRYLGRRVGLAGSNDWESLLIDVVGDTCNDFRMSESSASFIVQSINFISLLYSIIYSCIVINSTLILSSIFFSPLRTLLFLICRGFRYRSRDR